MDKLPKQLNGLKDALGLTGVELGYASYVFGELSGEIGSVDILKHATDEDFEREVWADRGVPYRVQEELVHVITSYLKDIDPANREIQSLDQYLGSHRLTTGLRRKFVTEREIFSDL